MSDYFLLLLPTFDEKGWPNGKKNAENTVKCPVLRIINTVFFIFDSVHHLPHENYDSKNWGIDQPGLVMEQKYELKGILFTIVAFDEVDWSKVVHKVSGEQPKDKFPFTLVEFIWDIPGIPFVQGIVLKDYTLLH
jgi:hypothetical protein